MNKIKRNNIFISLPSILMIFLYFFICTQNFISQKTLLLICLFIVIPLYFFSIGLIGALLKIHLLILILKPFFYFQLFAFLCSIPLHRALCYLLIYIFIEFTSYFLFSNLK